MANRNFPNNKLYQFEVMPVLLSCNFKVAATDTGGLGITNLKGAGIKSVYMHTSATAATGNPNPASGYIQVQFQDNYNYFLSMFGSIWSPNSGSDLTATTAHVTYVITALGTATLAQWRAKGLPVGVTPAVGVSFIATAAGTIGGSAIVQVPSVSNISSIEVVGNPNQALALSQSAVNGGGIIELQCLAVTDAAPTLTMASYTPAGTNDSATPPIFTGTPAVLTGTISAPTVSRVATAPAAGSIISLNFYLSNSSVTLAGQ